MYAYLYNKMKQNRIHTTLKPLYNQCVSREIYKMYTQNRTLCSYFNHHSIK